MKDVLLFLVFALSFSACGKTGSPEIAREGGVSLHGTYQSTCAEWKGGDYQTSPDHPLFAIARFNFQENRGYAQNISFYREGDCRIEISELKTSGSLDFKEAGSLFYFQPHFSEFRVMGENRVASYQAQGFCNHRDWINGVWRDVHSQCFFGSQSVYTLSKVTSASTLNFYPCDDPGRGDVYCPLLRMLKTTE